MQHNDIMGGAVLHINMHLRQRFLGTGTTTAYFLYYNIFIVLLEWYLLITNIFRFDYYDVYSYYHNSVLRKLVINSNLKHINDYGISEGNNIDQATNNDNNIVVNYLLVIL